MHFFSWPKRTETLRHGVHETARSNRWVHTAWMVLLATLGSTANATTLSDWIVQSERLLDAQTNVIALEQECSACHSLDRATGTDLIIPDQEVAFDADELAINLPAAGVVSESSFSWRYRVRPLTGNTTGDVIDEDFFVHGSNNTTRLALGTDSDAYRVQYCVGQTTFDANYTNPDGQTFDSGQRVIRCDDFDILRDSAPVEPLVLSSSTSSLTLEAGTGTLVQAVPEGGDPSAYLFSVSSADESAVAISLPTSPGGGFAIEAIAPSNNPVPVTITVSDGAQIDSVVIPVQVTAPAVALSLTSNLSSVSLELGDGPVTLVTTASGGGSSNYSFSASSSDTSRVTATESTSNAGQFLIEGAAVTSAPVTVTITVSDGDSTASVSVPVTVTAAAVPLSATVNTNQLSLAPGESATVQVTAMGGPSTSYQFDASSDASAVATADADGSSGGIDIEAVSDGSARISIEVTSGSETVTVSVNVDVETDTTTLSGQQIVETDCVACHQNSAFDGVAPQLGDDSAWIEAITNAGGLDGLLATVRNGGSGMPAYMDVYSESQRRAATVFLSGGVEPSNNPPVVTPSSLANLQLLTTAAPIEISLTVTDENPGTVQYSATSSNTAAVDVASLGGGRFSLAPDGTGTSTITLSVSDELNQEVTRTFTVTVSEPESPDEPPSVSPTSLPTLSLTAAGDTATVSLTVSDESPADLVFGGSSDRPDIAEVTHSGNGVFVVQPVAAGTARITLSVRDAANPAVTRDFQVDVAAAPVFAAGQELYEAECQLCHGNGVEGAPQRGDRDAWVASLGRNGGIDGLLNIVRTGQNNGRMPSFAGRFDDAELRGALVYLLDGAEPPPPDEDGDGVPDASDNCPRDPNGDQADDDNNGVGNVCDRPPEAPNRAPEAQSDVFVLSDFSQAQRLDVLSNDRDPDDDPVRIALDADRSSQGVPLAVDGSVVVYGPVPGGNLANNDQFTYRVLDDSDFASDSVRVDIVLSDGDGDGVPDQSDNCPSFPNGDQSDMDSDGLGDGCDTTPTGDQPLELPSGRELVQAECLVCHQAGVSGAPRLGDTDAWNSRLSSAGGAEGLLDSVVNGRGAMPAFGGQYSSLELLAAVRFISGVEGSGTADGGGADGMTDGTGGTDPGNAGGDDGGGTDPGTEPGTGTGAPVAGAPPGRDSDLDGVADVDDNCPSFPNSDQSNADNDELGDACEADADNDGDGYVFASDNDDSDATRLPAESGDSPGLGYLSSDLQRLRLGPVATSLASSGGPVRLDVSEDQFDAAAADVFNGVMPMVDAGLNFTSGVLDVVASDLLDAEATILITLTRNNLPIGAALRLYDPTSGEWKAFDAESGDQLLSAPQLRGNCPSTRGSNYQPDLRPGLGCVVLVVADGGVNDTDMQANGEVHLMFRIAGRQDDGAPSAGSPEVINTSGGGGGGGALNALLLLLASLFLHTARRRRA